MTNRTEHREVRAVLSAGDTWSQPLCLHGPPAKSFTVVVEAGKYVLKPTLQLSADNATWTDFSDALLPPQNEANHRAFLRWCLPADDASLVNIGAVASYTLHGDWFVRIGIKADDHTSGEVVMHLRRSF